MALSVFDRTSSNQWKRILSCCSG